jgi:hypothetical protein
LVSSLAGDRRPDFHRKIRASAAVLLTDQGRVLDPCQCSLIGCTTKKELDL